MKRYDFDFLFFYLFISVCDKINYSVNELTYKKTLHIYLVMNKIEDY